jgi:hypothetical protein
MLSIILNELAPITKRLTTCRSVFRQFALCGESARETVVILIATNEQLETASRLTLSLAQPNAGNSCSDSRQVAL